MEHPDVLQFDSATDADGLPVKHEGEAGEVFFAEASADLIAERDGVDVTSYRLPPCPHVFRHPLRAAAWMVRAAFGIISLILLLAVIAAIPVVNFLALGYLLEAEGRVARSGRIRNAFLLLDVAPRIGSVVLGIWLWILPLRLLGTARGDAYFLDPGGNSDQFLSVFSPLAASLVATHLCLALARGGSLSCFFRPIKNIRWLVKRWQSGDYMAQATAGVQDFIQRLRLRHHFWLGVRGFAGAFIWLIIPTALFASATPDGGGRNLLAGIGGIGLAFVLSWLPFLQARFAMTGQWKDMFDRRSIRLLFRRTPLAWFLATAVVYVLALPLYLPKVYLLPSDAMWLVTLVFIVTIYPARILTGWVVHRAMHRETTPWFGFRWLSRWLIVPLISLYVFLLFFTPLIGEHGKGVLFEHHALLLPVPF